MSAARSATAGHPSGRADEPDRREKALSTLAPVTGGRHAIIAAAATLALSASACGNGDAANEPEPPGSFPAPKASEFPKPERGQTLTELRAELPQESLVLAPSVSVLEPGEPNRFGFGLFDAARNQITEAPVAVYVARAGGGEIRGPYPARYESLAVSPQFQSAGAEADPDSASSVYVAEVPFEKPGRHKVLGVTRIDDQLVAAT